MTMDEIQTEQADRHVDEEDDSPVKVADDEPAGDGPEHRANQRRYGDEAHGADQLRFGERPDHREAADGHHHGSAEALEDAASHEDVDVARDAAENRTQREEAH